MSTFERVSSSALPSVAEEQETPAVAGRTARVEFLGVTRGAAVLYIVFGHIVGNFRQPDLADPALWDVALKIYTRLDLATTGTRLPLLILMTGLFLERSLARGTRRFIFTRAKSLLWPLILWGLVQGVIFASNPQLTPWHGQWEREGLNLLGTSLASFRPIPALYAWMLLVCEQLWFLNMLAIFLVLYLFARRLPRAVLFGIAVLSLIASLAIESLTFNWSPGLLILTRLGPYFFFFVLGTLMSDWIVKGSAHLTRTQAIIAGCLFLALAGPLIVVGPVKGWTVALTFLSALPAIPLLFNAGKWLANSPARMFFRWAGQASLLLLCLHMLCIALVLALARAAGVTSPPLLVVLATVGGIGLCFLIDHALRRTGLSAAFGFQPAI